MSVAKKKRTDAGKKRKKVKNCAGKIILIAAGCTALLCVFSMILTERLERKTYALAYQEIISTESANFAVDPYLVAAVIHCESSGRAEVVSHKGAVGLMQIMPKTGAWIAEKLEMESFLEEQLKDPETNVRMGCWYLSYLLKRYEGNRIHALAAYNAGPGNVSKWLEDPAYAPEGQLTDIPFEETSAYVKKVLAAEEKYRELYEEELD
ncbi:MAG: lytic transglycosylase domain-containing protein [Clostridiales bacterium]|nr:lytic transglycosylase domain-containing protein [Clostridiales bacterium]